MADDEDDDFTVWDALDQQSKQRRADNRANSPKLLEERGISFSSHNGGAHLIVYGKHESVDFWPGTGRWMVRAKDGKKGFGVFNLIKRLEGK